MSPNRKLVFQAEGLDSRVLLSAINPLHQKFVDVTGEIMRQDLVSPPRVGPHAAQVYSFQGAGGVNAMGRVETSGSVTETTRGASHQYKGKVTLSNEQGSVRITFTSSQYRIIGGTGVYRGAKGLGAVSVGTIAGKGPVGLAFTADL